MIDAQSIVVAGAATQQVGNEAAIFRAVLKHSLVLAAAVGLIVSAFAFALPAWVPKVKQAAKSTSVRAPERTGAHLPKAAAK
jgi:hypothetical protein